MRNVEHSVTIKVGRCSLSTFFFYKQNYVYSLNYMRGEFMKILYLILILLNLFFLYFDLIMLYRMLKYAFTYKDERIGTSKIIEVCMSTKQFRHVVVVMILKLIVISLLIMLMTI